MPIQPELRPGGFRSSGAAGGAAPALLRAAVPAGRCAAAGLGPRMPHKYA